jgi:cytochrome c oxidase subunit 2
VRPADISTEGWRIDEVIDRASQMIAAVAAIAVIWLVVAVVRGVRRESAEVRPLSRAGVALPLAIAAAVFLIVDGYLFYRSTVDLGALLDVDRALADPGAVRIEVSGQQWAWNVRYAGPDGAFATADDPVSLNHIVVPLGDPVIIQLASADVVHSLWIPNLRIKRDAIPGRVTEIWFEATEPGRYPIACAQFCGVSHHQMTGWLEVVPRPELEAWLADRAADSQRIAEEDERALEDEPGRQPPAGQWPRFAPDRFGRDWGWTWH